MAAGVKHAEVIARPDGRLDTKSAAVYLGLAEKTLAMMRCYGTGPRFVKLGRVFYYLQDLDEWLGQAQRVRSTAQQKRKTTVDVQS